MLLVCSDQFAMRERWLLSFLSAALSVRWIVWYAGWSTLFRLPGQRHCWQAVSFRSGWWIIPSSYDGIVRPRSPRRRPPCRCSSYITRLPTSGLTRRVSCWISTNCGSPFQLISQTFRVTFELDYGISCKQKAVSLFFVQTHSCYVLLTWALVCRSCARWSITHSTRVIWGRRGVFRSWITSALYAI